MADPMEPNLRAFDALATHAKLGDLVAITRAVVPCDHARSAGTFLTGVPYKLTAGADVYGAISMDQIVAKELAKETQLGSLELGIESNAMLGSCDALAANSDALQSMTVTLRACDAFEWRMRDSDVFRWRMAV